MGGSLEEVEQHPLDGDGRVVLRRGQPVAQLDELQDLVEGAATVGGYDEVDRLEGEAPTALNFLHYKSSGQFYESKV